MNYFRFFLKFFVAYVLLGSVLLVVDVPNLGLLLSLLAETPVSGYYVLVMRAELLSYPEATKWGQLPVWDARRIGELYWLGSCMNAIMGIYAFAASILPLTVVAVTLALHGATADNLYLRAVVNAFSFSLLLVSAVPSLWILFFLQPIAIVRFAQTNRFQDAFQIRWLTQLSLKQCRYALIGALIMLAASVLNIASSLLLPEIIVLSEPSIEFTGIVLAFKFFARSYQSRLSDDEQKDKATCNCPAKKPEVDDD